MISTLSLTTKTVTPLINLAANYIDYYDVIVAAQLVPTPPPPPPPPPPLSLSSSSSALTSTSTSTSSFQENNQRQRQEIQTDRMSNLNGLPTRLAITTTVSSTTTTSVQIPITLTSSSQHQSNDNSLQQLISSFHHQNQHLLLNPTLYHLHHTSSTHPHQFLLDDFSDFDVSSLSSLCLGSGDNGNSDPATQQENHNPTIITKTTIISNSTTSTAVNSTAAAQQTINNQDHNNNINIPLINQFFSITGNGVNGGGSSSLSDMIKIEDEYHLQHHHHDHLNIVDHSSPTLLNNNNLQHFTEQHQNSTTSKTVVSSSSTSTSSVTHQQNPQKSQHSSVIMVRSQQQQSVPSPAMLMNHLDLSSIRSPPPSTPSTATSSTISMSSASLHHNLLHPNVNTTNTIAHRNSSGFDPNEIYYGDLNTDDSCQSLASVDSSTIVHNTKSLVLQSTTVLMPGGSSTGPTTTTSEEKLMNQVSKRIRFKGLIDQKHEEQEQQQQQQPQQQQQTHQQQNLDQHLSDQQLDLNTAILEQNPFAYRPNAETFNENFYSSRNVANCYSYAWRRWSKTDAPSVKNRAGTVQVPHTMPRIDEDGRKFQYILGAPTSAGTRVGSMTMTYLNQGQSYEIRLKKLKKVPQEPNLKTSVRLGFVEKRLQYRENEELSGWIVAHNNGRMIDIDFSMSYGVFDVDLGSTYNHSMTFVWNPGREASIFIKINCISTEFTSKRHGGERGTPFRLIVDTHAVDGTKLDSACCLIKVFKSKGAERKHKTDRDRVAKHPDSENYYQPSYDCTLLTTYKDEDNHQQTNQDDQQRDELTNRSTESPSGSELSIPNTPISPNVQLLDHHSSQMATKNIDYGRNNLPLIPSPKQEHYSHQQQLTSKSESINLPVTISSCESSSSTTISSSIPSSIRMASTLQSTCQNEPDIQTSSSSTLHSIISQMPVKVHSSATTPLLTSSSLPLDAGAIETYEWLKRNRFFRLAEQLCDYTAEDLRRLSRDDLIQLCDFKDGIRLYNLIHMPQVVTTKLTIFITLDGSEHYALYFKHLTVEEFREKLTESLKNNVDHQKHDGIIRIRNIHMTGPNGIRVKLTNNVIQNMKNESIYSCLISKVDGDYDIVIRLINN